MSAQTVAPDADELRRLYHDEGLSQREVAEALNISEGSVYKYIHEYAIETPASGSAYTRTQYLDVLRRLDAGLPGRPSGSDVEAVRDAPCRDAYTERFGSFADALAAAGIDADVSTTAQRYHNRRRRRASRSSYRETLGEGQGVHLQGHPTAAYRLQRTSDPFAYRDLDVAADVFHTFIDTGVIAHAGTEAVAVDGGKTYDRWLWAAADGVRAWIDSHVDPPGECPASGCHAAGIENLGDGRYTCSREACDSAFGRETAREVLGR